jgi:hypothetical protein
MTGPLAGRDDLEVDALITDRYLETLLAAHARSAGALDGDGPAAERPAAGIARAADRLSRDLLRLHPSFLFEEALAGRLSELASRMRLAPAAGAEGAVIPMPSGGLTPLLPLPGADGTDEALGHPGFGRPLLIGGALTSAALSIAGAAYVAWRLNRPTAGPMARAVRAVARSRLA